MSRACAVAHLLKVNDWGVDAGWTKCWRGAAKAQRRALSTCSCYCLWVKGYGAGWNALGVCWCCVLWGEHVSWTCQWTRPRCYIVVVSDLAQYTLVNGIHACSTLHTTPHTTPRHIYHRCRTLRYTTPTLQYHIHSIQTTVAVYQRPAIFAWRITRYTHQVSCIFEGRQRTTDQTLPSVQVVAAVAW